MTSCSFVAPGLVASVSGQVPTFSFSRTGHSDDAFGVRATFLHSGTTCYNQEPQFTPYVTNSVARFSRECDWVYSAPSYTGLYCSVHVTAIPDGPLTINYKGIPPASPTPIPFVASFGPEPPHTTTTVATLSTTTSSASVAPPTSTITVTHTAAPDVRHVTIQTITTSTSTETVSVSSCSSSSSSTVSSSSSTSSAPVSSSSSSSSSSTSSSSNSSSSSSSSTSSAPTPSSSSSSSSSTSAPSSSVSSSSSSAASTSSFSSSAPASSSSSSTSISSSSSSSSSSSTTSSAPATLSSASSTAPTCPGSDGATFSTSAGDFVIECYVDRDDHDIGPTKDSVPDFASCVQACASTAGCVDVSYIPNGPCYLKNGLGVANKNAAVWGARLVSASSSSSSPTASGICPGSNGTTVQTSAGPFEIQCSLDHQNFDMSDSPVYPGSYNNCLEACANRPGCVQVTYTDGPCYLKNGVGKDVPNSGNNLMIGGHLVQDNRPPPSSTSSADPATVTVTTTVTASCDPSAAAIKFHRKRVVHTKRAAVAPEHVKLEKRAIFIGPDFTYIHSTSTVTSTQTSTSTTTVTTGKAATITSTSTTTPTTTSTVTQTVSDVSVATATVTSCPTEPAPRF